MPSLEQIIRPFVVDPTTPPVPVITTLNKPPPDPVRLNIGIDGRSLSSLSSKVAPIVPPKSEPKPTVTPKIQMKSLSSSYSFSQTNYMTGVVREKATEDDTGGDGGTTGGGGGGSQGGAGTTKDASPVDYLKIKFPAGSDFEQQFLGRPSSPIQIDPAPAGNPPAPSAGGPVGGTGGSP